MSSIHLDSAKVYIIESPSAVNILENVYEGKPLSNILNMSGIQNEHFLVINRKVLASVFEKIIDDAYNSATPIMPYIHISAHGSDDGFKLADDDLIEWKVFKEYLDTINTSQKLGYFTPTGSSLLCSPITLCMSVCNGINGMKMCNESGISPYAVLIGPTESVHWADALIAFSTFYHLCIFKDKRGDEVVVQMNDASGLDKIFKFNFGNEFFKAVRNSKIDKRLIDYNIS